MENNKATDQQLILEVKNLSVSFENKNDRIEAVRNISFQIQRGEVLGLVGESGSGKSVTARSILQLTRYTNNLSSKGEIVYNNELGESFSLVNATDKALQKLRGKEMAMIFQEPMSALNPVFKCGHQVRDVITYHQKINKKAAKEKVKNLFDQVYLSDFDRIYNAYPHQLSGGQLQRVMIAMAISNQPKMLIADEPTTALDVSIQKEIIDLLQELRGQRQMSMLFISHDLNLVSEFADRVMVMRRGEVLEQGRTQSICSQPQNAYTQGLLACRPLLDHKLKRLPTLQDFESDRSDGLNFDNYLNQLKADKEAQAPSGEPLLRVSDLTVDYPIPTAFGQKKMLRAVDRVSFDLHKGQIIGLVGESGSGKSTIGNTLAGLIVPTEGSLEYEGIEINTKSFSNKKITRDIQIVFQDPFSALNPSMSVGNAILEPMLVHNLVGSREEGKQRVFDLLEKVGLESEMYDRYSGAFSGGQRQRIGIARALATEAKILVCDESVASLDVSIQAQILNLLSDLREETALSILFISHDLAVVRHLCDWIVVLNKGKVVESGLPKQIFETSKNDYTQKLIKAIPKGIFS
ncbi:MAG: ABC transporter ATP-binding protein [Bacteroidota bacterium]